MYFHTHELREQFRRDARFGAKRGGLEGSSVAKSPEFVNLVTPSPPPRPAGSPVDLTYSPSPPAAASTPPRVAAAAPLMPPPAPRSRSRVAPPFENDVEGYVRYRTADRTELPPILRLRRSQVPPSHLDRFVADTSVFGGSFLNIERVFLDIRMEEQAAIAWPKVLDEVEGPDDAMKRAHVDEACHVFDNMLLRVQDQEWDWRDDIVSLGAESFTRTRTIASGGFGVAMMGDYRDSAGTTRQCVGKFVKLDDADSLSTSWNELMVHSVLLYHQGNDPEIRAQQAMSKMAKIPRLFRAGIAGRLDATGRTRLSYFFFLMEPLGTDVYELLHRRNTQRLPNNLSVSAPASVVLYQTANALRRFGQLCQFNHRDLKTTNLLVKTDPTVRTRFCRFPDFFQTYIIDFGFSRVTHRNRVVAAMAQSFGYAVVARYNPHTDIQFLTRAMLYHPLYNLTDAQLARYPIKYEATFEHLLEELTNNVGTMDGGMHVLFPRTVRLDLNAYAAFFNAVPLSGHMTVRGVLNLMKLYIRFVASRCSGRANSEALRIAVDTAIATPMASPADALDIPMEPMVDLESPIIENFDTP